MWNTQDFMMTVTCHLPVLTLATTCSTAYSNLISNLGGSILFSHFIGEETNAPKIQGNMPKKAGSWETVPGGQRIHWAFTLPIDSFPPPAPTEPLLRSQLLLWILEMPWGMRQSPCSQGACRCPGWVIKPESSFRTPTQIYHRRRMAAFPSWFESTAGVYFNAHLLQCLHPFKFLINTWICCWT